MEVQGGKQTQLYHRNALTVYTDKGTNTVCTYISAYTIIILSFILPHTSNKNTFWQNPNKTLQTNTQHANETDNQLYYFMYQ